MFNSGCKTAARRRDEYRKITQPQRLDAFRIRRCARRFCGAALNRFTETECRNCFTHCGYRYTQAGCDLAATPATRAAKAATARWSRRLSDSSAR
jgi:hypothetical protein